MQTANFPATEKRGGDDVAKVSKAQQACVHRYVKANYDRMELTVPKGEKDKIKARADELGESVNGYINRLIQEDMNRG